jgi:DNA polymerase III subunit delta'
MWDNIIGQGKVKNFLKSIHKNNRLHHAFIFHGTKGIGKDALAIEFAKALNCEHFNNDKGACDECRTCKDIGKFHSRFVKFITALPASRSDNPSDDILQSLSSSDYELLLSELEIKSKNLYYKVNIPKANTIRIDSIRQLIKEAYLTVSRKNKKVFIISECDMMNPNTANSLLKVLEEPPANTIIILTTSKLTSLLPTIIGRCQKIKFESLSKSDIKQYLLKFNPDLSETESELFSEIAQGSLGTFQDLEIDSYKRLRDAVIDSLRYLMTSKYLSMNKSISIITESKNKNLIKLGLYILMIWFRDVNTVYSGDITKIINQDMKDIISKFAKSYKADIFKILTLIENVLRDMEFNVNPELMFNKLLFDIKINIKPI